MSQHKATPITPIARGGSVPRDPAKPSFIKTLPPEIRNAIYLLAFVRDHQVEIVSARKLKESLTDEYHGYADYALHEDEDELLGAVKHTIETPCVCQDTFPVILLRSCRQVYHEAVGLLYGSNAFLVRIPSHRHNNDNHQVNTTVAWIQCLGSQVLLVSRISIDTSLTCPDNCLSRAANVPFGPLAKLLWSMPFLRPRIEFTNASKEFDLHLHSSFHTSGQLNSESSDASTLNRILESLVVDDCLQIRQYAHSDRLIGYLSIDSDLMYGGVAFPVTADGQRGRIDINKTFEISEHGKRIEWILSSIAPSHLGVELHILDSILERVIDSSGMVIFDVDRRSMYGLDLNIFAVCRDLRFLATSKVLNSHTMVVRKCVRYARGVFYGLDDLVNWLDGPGRAIFPQVKSRSNQWAFNHPPIIEIVLEDLSQSTSTEAAGLKVTTLIAATYDTEPTTMVRFLRASEMSDGSYHTILTTTIEKLRKDAFLLLSQFMVENPGQGESKCPEIWINSSGEVFKIAYLVGEGEEGGVVKSLYRDFEKGRPAERSEAEASRLAARYIERIEPAGHLRGWMDPPLETYHLDGTLFPMWRAMRDRDWERFPY